MLQVLFEQCEAPGSGDHKRHRTRVRILLAALRSIAMVRGSVELRLAEYLDRPIVGDTADSWAGVDRRLSGRTRTRPELRAVFVADRSDGRARAAHSAPSQSARSPRVVLGPGGPTITRALDPATARRARSGSPFLNHDNGKDAIIATALSSPRDLRALRAAIDAELAEVEAAP